MVSKTLASLDAWLADAEQVLAEQRNHLASETWAREHRSPDAVQLSLFGGEL
jgi:hypothetical protein